MPKKKKRLFDEEGNEVFKKPFYKRVWFWVIVVLVLVIGVSGGEEDESTTPVADDTEETVAEKPVEVEPEPEPEIEPEVDPELERQFTIMFAESIAQETFIETASVHYSESEDAMIITPTDDDFIMALYFLETGLMDISEWDNLRDSFLYYSSTLSEAVDKNISVMVVNPANENNYILKARNGEVIYDVFNE